QEQKQSRTIGERVGSLESQLRAGSALAVSLSRQQLKQQKAMTTKQIK
ncbi:unnamed protein product, partial [marine sediment metagenome]